MSERLTSWKNDPYVCLKATVGRLSSTTTWLNIWSKIQAMLIFIARWYSGWWLTYPSEKYESQLGWLFPIYGNIKHVPNHQPVLDARKPLSFPRVSKNSLSQGCSKPPTSFQIPHETYGLWHQLPGSDLGQLRHWPRAKNLNDVTKVGGFPGWSWVAWWLKKIKQLRRFSQLYLFYLSCFFGSWRKVYHDFWENREETVDNPNARIRIFRQVNGNMFGEGAWSQYKDLGKSWKIDFARFKTCDSVIFSCSVMSKPLLPTIDIDLTWAFHWCIMKSLMIHAHGGCNGWTTCREKNITNHCYHKEKTIPVPVQIKQVTMVDSILSHGHPWLGW